MPEHWTRPPPRTPRPPSAPAVFTIFREYPAELVAEWRGISVATARLYKADEADLTSTSQQVSAMIPCDKRTRAVSHDKSHGLPTETMGHNNQHVHTRKHSLHRCLFRPTQG